MDEFEDPIDYALTNKCWECIYEDGSCCWLDSEVIEEFICQLNSDPDGILTLDLILGWYWNAN